MARGIAKITGIGRDISLIAMAIAGVTVVSPTFAQERAPEATPEAGGEQQNEIVVTARRRAEDPQDVPIALSVFGGDALEKQNVFSVDQLQRQAPSLQIIGNNPRNTNINIRGLGANIGLQNDGLENGVGV